VAFDNALPLFATNFSHDGFIRKLTSMPDSFFARLIDVLTCGTSHDPVASTSNDAPPPVMVNKQFIGPQAQRLFHTLQRHYGPTGHVLAEVALNRLIYFPNSADRKRRARWWGRIAQRSVDFVILDPKSLHPMLAIELDDKTHLSAKREGRDTSVNTICAAAGLRLVRVPGNVTVEELKTILTGMN
jgi:Protein of unknown function (DUF2726)